MKPLNPFLGELFEGYWDSEMGRIELVAEQVSHHPPVTACRIWNQEAGVSVCLLCVYNYVNTNGRNSSKAILHPRRISLRQSISNEKVTRYITSINMTKTT